jgi:3-oxoacyl-[acyl-carrier protein] reductase
LTAQAGELSLAGPRTGVTGASSGIGRAIATAFAAAGARVGIGFNRSSEGARALAEELGGGGAHPLLRADLSTPDGCVSIVQQAFAAPENVDVWVNSAGADVLTGESARWPAERKLEAVVELDLKATIRCSPLVAARMRPGGCILDMGWDHATIDGMAGDNPELFATVKAGVLGFSKSFALGGARGPRGLALTRLDRDGLRGGRGPRLLRRGRRGHAAETLGRPHDGAGAAVWLASPVAAFVTGQATNVNGGTIG